MRDHFRLWYLMLTFAASGSGLSAGLLTLPWRSTGSVYAASLSLVLFVFIGGWAMFAHHGVYRSTRTHLVSWWLCVQLVGSAIACGFLATQVMFAGTLFAPGGVVLGVLVIMLFLLIKTLNRVFAALERPWNRIVR